MAEFKNLITVGAVPKDLVQIEKYGGKKRQKRQTGRGCEHCTLNKVKGIKKIFGRVSGVDLMASEEEFEKQKRLWKKEKKSKYGPKKIMVWAQSPGFMENSKETELIGPAGQFLWDELAKVGIERKDCDIQNVVRCFPADRDEDESPPFKMRNPSKEEIKCCSIYNEVAAPRSRARIHFVFGKVAAAALLGREYNKTKKIFWSQKLQARVAVFDHPSFFLRQGFGGRNPRPANYRLKQFRKDLQHGAKLAKIKRGKYGFIETRRYIGVENVRQAREAYREILRWHKRGERIVGDLEEGLVGRDGRPTKDGTGRRTGLAYGFCGKIGVSYVFPLDAPLAPGEPGGIFRRLCSKLVKKILRRADIRKCFHHGSYDTKSSREVLGISVRGYDYDTNYAEYLYDPPGGGFKRKSYKLDRIADRHFPSFAGYKEIIAPESFTDLFLRTLPKKTRLAIKRRELDGLPLGQLVDNAKKIKNGINLARLPWKKMVMYNGADNDLTKRIEVRTREEVNLPLVHVFRDAAYILDDMEANPPLFDYKHCEKMKKVFPVRAEYWLKKIRKIAIKYGYSKDFNPGSPKQLIELLYKKMHLPFEGKKANTQKNTLLMLADSFPIADYVGKWRHDKKADSTYVKGFETCANLNGGHLQTFWWATGTGTGRLSSGGGPDGEGGVVNLQNIHGDPQLQNLAISDENWRDIYEDWKVNGDFDEERAEEFGDYYVMVGADQSQMELRVLAQKSGDKNLQKMFADPKNDPHSLVGHELTSWSVKKIKEDDRVRRFIKGMHFGIVFGLDWKGLYRYLIIKGVKTTKAQVRKFHRKYFERFPGVGKMIKADRDFVEKHHFVMTLTGFKRPLNLEQQQEEDYEGAYWGNQAVNTPIQGTAHHLMLMVMAALYRNREKYKLLLKKMQMEIHDALYFRIKLKYLWKAVGLIRELMEKEPVKMIRKEFGVDWKVPLLVEPKAAFRFGVQVKELGMENGPKTTAEFLNVWCKKNQESQRKLKKELAEVHQLVAV